MICRICSTTEGPFRAHSTTICQRCDNARARQERLARFVREIQTVDVIVPCEPSIRPEHAYHAMSAITRRVDAVHDNGAVAVVIESGQIRFRLFAGAMPSWMTDTNHRWEPMRVADFSPLVDRDLDLQGSIHRCGVPVVESLRPSRCLRMVAMQKHNQRKTRQTETVRRRLLAGGVLCMVARDGDPYRAQTGSADAQEQNHTECTPLRIFTATERDGLVAQMRPIGAGGRFGGGVCIALPEQHDLTILPSGLRGLKAVSREIGVDEHTIQNWMRKLGYDWIHTGHGRWFDDVMVERLREKIPSLAWRVGAPKTRKLWTDAEERIVWDAIMGRASWSDVAAKVERTSKACKIKAIYLRREAALVV